jgi:hypothetical protein
LAQPLVPLPPLAEAWLQALARLWQRVPPASPSPLPRS